jgi:predicted N-formylglutamate amidohydrolase
MDNEKNKNNFLKKLLADDEPPAFEVVNTNGASQFVLVCDHASKRVPRCLNNLGLTDEQLDDHIGWDPGAAEVARLLSKNLNAPLVLSGYSRLVIDCNRPLQSVQSIPEQSAGVMVIKKLMKKVARYALMIYFTLIIMQSPNCSTHVKTVRRFS